MSSGFEEKVRGRLGLGPQGGKTIRILDRIVAWGPGKITFEADLRHAELIAKDISTFDACKAPVVAPGMKIKVPDGQEGPELSSHSATQYRRLVARADYLARDRYDTQLSVK